MNLIGERRFVWYRCCVQCDRSFTGVDVLRHTVVDVLRHTVGGWTFALNVRSQIPYYDNVI